MAHRLPLLLLLALSRVRGVVGEEKRIKDEKGFKDFVNEVNKGTSYEGTTVLLDADLSLSQYNDISPIGKETDKHFRGTFDGQGHIISGLKISSSSFQYTGLFGYSSGLTIKNVVLDSSCSITSSSSSSDNVYVGGIIGRCNADDGQCNIENTVNMADVKFSGQANNNIFYLGGIAGLLKTSSSHSVYVKNCANYGSVTHSGTGSNLRIGGIAGSLDSDTSYALYVHNTINYGEVKYSGTLPYSSQFNGDSSLGGITGSSFKNIYFENCVSAGKITSKDRLKTGSIVGYVYDNTHIKYCYYTSDVRTNDKYGTGTPASTEGTPDGPTDVNSDLVSNLTNYASNRGWSKWLLNEREKTVSFSINNDRTLSLSLQLILLPSLAGYGASNSNEITFSGWYNDSECTNPLELFEVAEDTTFYGLYGVIVVVTFNANGGNIISFTSKKAVLNSAYGTLSDANRTGYTFSGWFNESKGGTKVTKETNVTTSSNHILYANWTANKYIVTFNANGGSVSESSRIVTYDSKYGTLPEPTREECTFNGWFTERRGGTKVTEETNVTTPYDHTLYAQWTINNYTLTFDFGDGTVTNSTVKFKSPIDYPKNVTREGYTFNGWDSTYEFMPAQNLTITAQWTINNYTLTFDFGNGTENEVRIVDFNSSVDYPPNPEREGYTFGGWNSTYEFMPAQDLTITANWTANEYTVTFDANEGSVLEATKNVTYDSKYGTLPVAYRIGYTFSGWFTSKDGGEKVESTTDVTASSNHTLYAHWTISNYALTFDFDNGTVTNSTVEFNSPINYPPEPTRKGYTFCGWNNNVTNMPAQDLTITAQWTTESSKNKKSSVGTIAGVVIPMFIIIIAALIILILFILKRRKEDDDDDESRSRNSITGSDSERKVELGRSLLDDDDRKTERYVPADRYNRVVPKSNYEKEIKPVVGPPKLDLKDLYPAGYARPAMKDALLEAGFTEKQADTICSTCNEAAQGVAADGNLPSGFTEADAAAIAMYTYDLGEKDGENSPFSVINKSLAGTSYDDLRKVSGLLYLVLAALRKLDRVMGSTLYRGVQGKMNLEEEGYIKGNVVTWMALASVSSDIEATKRVVGADEEEEGEKKKKKKKKPGTLFIIEDGWGYDIQPYSLYPGEEEILFEPERRFIVTSVIQSTELTFINLKMLDTPLSMPQISNK